MSLLPATVKCWWDASVWPSRVWARLAAEAEDRIQNADLSSDWFYPCELYAIACDIASFAELLELRADLAIQEDEE